MCQSGFDCLHYSQGNNLKNILLYTPSLLSEELVSVGGHKAYNFSYVQLEPYMLPCNSDQLDVGNNTFKYADHVNDIGALNYPSSQFIHVRIPLQNILPHLAMATI